MTYVKLILRIRRIKCMNVDDSLGIEKINDFEDIFFNFSCSDKVQISLCFPPFDLICDDVHSFKDGAIFFFIGAFISLISLGITWSIGKVLTQNGMKTINHSSNLQNKYNLLSLVYKTKCYSKTQFSYKIRFVYTGQNWIYEEDKIGEILNDILSELLGKI